MGGSGAVENGEVVQRRVSSPWLSTGGTTEVSKDAVAAVTRGPVAFPSALFRSSVGTSEWTAMGAMVGERGWDGDGE